MCMQTAVKIVENWAMEWDFRLSVSKTQVICFTKRKNNPILNGQQLEQVSVMRCLGMWMDTKLSFRVHIQKMVDKCQKAILVMRSLVGVEWGAWCQSVKRIYCALVRAAIDYGSMVYSSVSKSQLSKIEAIQIQALRICSGAIRSSPITALQVEMGEMPLEIRRLKL